MNERNAGANRDKRGWINQIAGRINVCMASSLTKAPDDPAVLSIRNDLRSLWENHFADGFDDTDGDIVKLLTTIQIEYWPPDLVADILVEIASFHNADTLSVRNSKRKGESCYLLECQDDNTSQIGEDGIIRKIFEIIGVKNRWCVEFGAWDGMKHSNTNRLISQEDWEGVLIEANSDRFQKLEATYAGNERAYLFNQTVGFDPGKDAIDFILGQTQAPRDIDLMVVDIDGNDWHIWRSMTKYRPRLLIIEFNPTISNDVFYVQARDPSIQRGCSLNALIALGKSKGYELVCATMWNGFFVVLEESEKLGIDDNSIDAMYTPFMDGRIFQGMDSTVHAVDMPSLMWDWRGLGYDWSRIVPERLVIHK